MILSFFTQKSTRSARLSSVFAERFSGEGQADFAINKAHKVSLKGRNNLYFSCVFNGFKYICIEQVYWYMYISQVSGERLQDHWSSGFKCSMTRASLIMT